MYPVLFTCEQIARAIADCYPNGTLSLHVLHYYGFSVVNTTGWKKVKILVKIK
jgi:hypothetical protein